MKLVNTLYNLEFDLIENQILVLSIENHLVYSNILETLWKQYKGENGDFILSDESKELKLSQKMDCIYNIFSINTNDRKIITKLYQELISYFDKAISTVPYNLKYNFDTDLSSLMKSLSVEIDDDSDSLLEKMMQYINLMNQICGVNIFVIPNLKAYFSTEEIIQLYEFTIYNKIYLIVIEAIQTPHIEGEKCWIIDEDLCIIEL